MQYTFEKPYFILFHWKFGMIKVSITNYNLNILYKVIKSYITSYTMTRLPIGRISKSQATGYTVIGYRC